MRKRSLGLIVALSVSMLALVPAASVAETTAPNVADARSTNHTLMIGFELHFTGPTTTSGTFVASGAVQDAGTSNVENIVLAPFGHQDRARLSGDQSFIGAQGTIVTRFSGIASDVSSPYQSGRGRFEVVSGTGAYAGLHGRGTFTIVVDVAGNHLIGTEVGHIH
jgi:hypothetical protein